jgi:hypothetical protein
VVSSSGKPETRNWNQLAVIVSNCSKLGYCQRLSEWPGPPEFT